MHDRRASHTHDPLYARALVLDNGETRLAFVMVDSCMLPRELCDQAKQRIFETLALKPGQALIAATHTHTAPCATSIFQSEPDPEYQHRLCRDIVLAVEDAARNLAPVRIGWGVGEVADEVFNRRWHMKPGSVPANPFGETSDRVRMNPPRQDENLIEAAGPTDPTVPFLALERLDGSPLAVLANYALHYVGGTDAGAISADYFGCFADALESMLARGENPPSCLVMLSNGCSGDVNNINFREAPRQQAPYEQMRAVANKVAEEVYARYRNVSFQDWVSLGNVSREISLGVRHPDGSDIARAQRIVDAVEGPEMRSLEEIYARETLLLAAYPDTVQAVLQALRIGDMAITAIPCEVFVEIGLAIKKDSPFAQTMAISLANGYNGYLPTAPQHELGGYETWRARSSYLAADAAEKIEQTLGGMLRELHA